VRTVADPAGLQRQREQQRDDFLTYTSAAAAAAAARPGTDGTFRVSWIRGDIR